MRYLGMSLLLFVAALLVAYTASLPMWVSKVSPSTVSTDPQIIMGLVAFVVTVLTLVGGAVYLLLKNELHREISREISTRLEIFHEMTNSRIFYNDYSKVLIDANFGYGLQNSLSRSANIWFQSTISNAIAFARQARDHSRSLSDVPGTQNIVLDATNDLAYHHATRYFFQKGERDKQTALALADDLKKYKDQVNYQETIAWVSIICEPRGSGKFDEGVETLKALLTDDNIDSSWRAMHRLKYRNLLGIAT